jgi:NAD(P)-dependent dehydrogenase (short-subunit alcohol dehydrogenase family)
MGYLDGRVAIVTGGGNGIGRAIATMFAAEGAKVVVNDLGVNPDGTGTDEGPVATTVAEIVKAGGEAVADTGDIADTATGERLVETAVSTFGKLDVLVNVAGILRDRMIFNMPPEDWDSVIRVHLRGHYSTIRPASAYWRGLRRPDGNFRIINFTSRSALDGSPGQSNYAAAKLGVVGFTYSLAQGLSRYGVTANAISPSAASRLVSTVPSEKVLANRAVDESPERSPKNTATLATYLAGEQSGWLTGRVLHVRAYDVGLYNNPEIIRQVTAEQPWTPDRLATVVQDNFRPSADGLPPSVFAYQRDAK